MTDEQRKIGLIRLGMNLASLRYEVSAETLKKLPIKVKGSGYISGRMKSLYFNPIYFYPKGFKAHKYEVGHDKLARYILKIVKN